MTKYATCLIEAGTPPTDVTDTKAFCDSAQKLASCEPKCACNDATYKAEFEESAKLVKAKSLAGSKCEHGWRTQRRENDWPAFLINFKHLLKDLEVLTQI